MLSDVVCIKSLGSAQTKSTIGSWIRKWSLRRSRCRGTRAAESTTLSLNQLLPPNIPIVTASTGSELDHVPSSPFVVPFSLLPILLPLLQIPDDTFCIAIPPPAPRNSPSTSAVFCVVATLSPSLLLYWSVPHGPLQMAEDAMRIFLVIVVKVTRRIR